MNNEFKYKDGVESQICSVLSISDFLCTFLCCAIAGNIKVKANCSINKVSICYQSVNGSKDTEVSNGFVAAITAKLNSRLRSRPKADRPKKRMFFGSRINIYAGSYNPTFQCLTDSTVLMQLSGDIELNPGPIKQPCSVCKKAVAVTHRALMCDSCELGAILSVGKSFLVNTVFPICCCL